MNRQPTLYDKIDCIVVKVIKYISYISAACLSIIMFIAFLNVVGEKLHKAGIQSITGIRMANEIIQYMHIPLVFLSAAYVTLDRGHTSIDIVTKRFPWQLRKVFIAIGYALGALICGYISYRAIFVLLPKQLSTFATITGNSSGWPVWPFAIIEGVGFFALSISFLWSIVRIMSGHLTREEEIPVESEAETL